jgi:uncharacterized protein
MTEITKYEPGSFCWTELATNDRKAAAEFYGSLFGWTPDEQPMGPDDVYVMLKKGDKVAAALYHDKQSGAPPHWNCYVAVTSADEAAEKAKSLGGTVIAPPFDVFEAGRMAVISDPEGAVFQVWEARNTKGADIIREEGALTWNELMSHQAEKARDFYTALFGWTAKGGPEYIEMHLGNEGIGGIFPMQGEMFQHVPANWMPYFHVSDCDASANKARSLGARIVKEPQDIPKVGRFAIISDPQGAMFNIFEAKM